MGRYTEGDASAEATVVLVVVGQPDAVLSEETDGLREEVGTFDADTEPEYVT